MRAIFPVIVIFAGVLNAWPVERARDDDFMPFPVSSEEKDVTTNEDSISPNPRAPRGEKIFFPKDEDDQVTPPDAVINIIRKLQFQMPVFEFC